MVFMWKKQILSMLSCDDMNADSVQTHTFSSLCVHTKQTLGALQECLLTLHHLTIGLRTYHTLGNTPKGEDEMRWGEQCHEIQMHKSRFQINHKSQISSSSWHDHDRTENASVGSTSLGLAACHFRNFRENRYTGRRPFPLHQLWVRLRWPRANSQLPGPRAVRV